MRLRLVLLMIFLRLLSSAHAQELLQGHAGFEQPNNFYQGDVSHYPSQYDHPPVSPAAAVRLRSGAQQSKRQAPQPAPKRSTLLTSLEMQNAARHPIQMRGLYLENLTNCPMNPPAKPVLAPCFKVTDGSTAQQMGLRYGDTLLAVGDPVAGDRKPYVVDRGPKGLTKTLATLDRGYDRPMVLWVQGADGSRRRLVVQWGFKWVGEGQALPVTRQPTQNSRPLPQSGFRSYIRR